MIFFPSKCKRFPLLGLLALASLAQSAASLLPQPRILIVIADNNQSSGSNTDLSALHAAFDTLAPPQPFDVVVVKSATEPAGGITPALNRGIALSTTVTVASMAFSGIPVNLGDYCQVWDLRFVSNCTALTCASTINASDQALYAAFLAGGGKMFLNGENAGYEGRNNGLTQFLTSIGTGAPFLNPSTETGTNVWNVFQPDPYGFPTTLNNLPALGNAPQPTVPGWYDICPACSGWGSSHPIAARINGGVTEAFMFGFTPSELAGGVGRVMTAFDWNGFWLFQQAENVPVYQNIYAWLGTCEVRFTVTKAANVSAAAVGSQFNYLLCVSNSGEVPLNQLIYDTLPPCIGFVSSSPPPAGNSGQYYWWSPGSIPIGGSACVTLTVQASSLACP